ncbi:hypothetical protein ACE193_09350 [Bernardetia sp. OM2101]|uniref:Cap15 family cyclic dinucleotide receptor domain-containing protein n=1 Tax=Bernardetia sp. OM2101 TaxID=3344876 RepID=UPI0035D0305D
MNQNYFNYYYPKSLLYLIITPFIIQLGVISLLSKFGFQNWLDMAITLSIQPIIIPFLYVVNRWLWKIKPFSYLLWIKDFNGTYEGYLEYEYRDENGKTKTGKLQHTKIIHQTGSTITIRSFTFKKNGEESSPSISREVLIKRKEDDTFIITYTYENEGNEKLKYPPHYGTEIIEVVFDGDEKKRLKGKYYTNRMPQTRGQFTDLKYINNKHNPPF